MTVADSMLLASGSGRGGSGARTLMRAAPGCSSAAARWSRRHSDVREQNEAQGIRLAAVGTLKRYSKALEYEYRVKTAVLGTLKRYSIFSLTLYLE
jgi:hypothetical protein